MKKNNHGFSLSEIVIAIMIITILSTISFLSYTNYISNARNATRITDMANIKISLKNHKLKNGGYPMPGNPFNITNSGVIINQGFLNEDVYTMELDKKPTDPLFKTQNYTYSITNNKQFFQVAMSLEDDSSGNDFGLRAYVDGDYQTLNDGFIPSLVFATSSSGTIQTLSGSSIVDNGTFNLPYNEDGNFIKNASSLSEIIAENGVNIPKYYGYSSCEEIYENGANMGSGNYILNGENATDC